MRFNSKSYGLRASPAAVTLGLLLSMAAPASATVTQAYYQRAFGVPCSGNTCNVILPKPAANTRIYVSRISCWMQTESTGTLGVIQFQNAGELMTQYFAPTQLGQKRALFNQEMDILIPAENAFGLTLFASGATYDANCTLTGRLQKLS